MLQSGISTVQSQQFHTDGVDIAQGKTEYFILYDC
jgi:hypothetical protein